MLHTRTDRSQEAPEERRVRTMGRDRDVIPQDYNARMAALWIMHGTACIKLLRAHGRALHADNFEAALREFVDIIADEVGRDTLTEAMDWAAGQISVFGGDFSEDAPTSIH